MISQESTTKDVKLVGFNKIVNTFETEIRMSNFYLLWKWNHFIGHQLQIIIDFFLKINELSFNFTLYYFCFSVNYLTLI